MEICRGTLQPGPRRCLMSVCRGAPKEAQRSPESFREAQRRTERPREAQRGPERPREAQRGRAWIEQACHALGWLAGGLAGWLRPREAQRGPERPREAQRGPEKPREPQRGTETHREAQRGPERPLYVQREAQRDRLLIEQGCCAARTCYCKSTTPSSCECSGAFDYGYCPHRSATRCRQGSGSQNNAHLWST